MLSNVKTLTNIKLFLLFNINLGNMVNFIPHYTNETFLLCAHWDLKERIKVVT